MKIPDVNVLINARDSSATQHEVARDWLERALSGAETVGFALVVLLGFIRISTNVRAVERPLTATEATEQVDQWLSVPTAQVVQPGRAHFRALASLLAKSGTAGNLTTDAHLAALASEHGATLVSFDGDFHRFEALSFEHLR